MVSLLKKLCWLKERWQRFRYVIHIEGEPYLIRYRLFRCERFGVYLHHIIRSDAGRELHDHPWDFTTVILWGGYTEITQHPPVRISEDGRWIPGNSEFAQHRAPWPPTLRKRKIGDIIRHGHHDLHRIIIKPGNTAWTLFFVGQRCERPSGKSDDWGFETEHGWVGQTKYHKERGYDSHGLTDQENSSELSRNDIQPSP